MLPPRARMDLGVIAIREYLAFFKAPALQEPHHQICLVSYPGYSYPSIEMQPLYSTALTDWANSYKVLTDKMKRSFFQAAVASILLYGCTTWTLTKRLEKKTAITQECCKQSWTSPGGNTPQDTNCTATCLLSRKLFKLDEPDMQDTAGEAGKN